MQEHGVEFAKDLGLKNARDLLALVEWNEVCPVLSNVWRLTPVLVQANNIRFMRVSSEMFPFASHKVWGYSLEYARAELEAVGKKAKEYGHRLTTHPGQFTQRECALSSAGDDADLQRTQLARRAKKSPRTPYATWNVRLGCKSGTLPC